MQNYNLLGLKFIVFVSNMERAIKFYKSALGLTTKFESPYWTEFELGTAIIALHITDIERPECQPVETGLSFTVSNIEQACEIIKSYGGLVISPPIQRVNEGIILATLSDTEGNYFFMTELLE